MLGILIALTAATGVAALTMIRRDLPLLALIAIFIIGAEMGEGFTSFQGSIFFNQSFLHLANLKLIEVILYSYAGILILLDLPRPRKLAPSPLRRLYWLWLVWLGVLLYVQYDTRGYFSITDFRGVYFGWAFLYVCVSVIDSRVAMRRTMGFTVILLTLKAAWLMFMFAIGRGDYTPRGHSPIFWDDKLLEAFTWTFLIFLVSILQPRDEKGGWRTTWVLISIALIGLLIVFSLRRNYLAQVAFGALFVLLFSGRQIQMQRILSLTFLAGVFLGVALIAMQAIGGRLPLIRQLTEYAQMLNFSSANDFSSLDANQVHLTNVQTYTDLLSEYEAIRFFGRSAAPTDDYQNFNREYSSSLGLAHNGPLRAIFDFGIGGLLVWAGFFYLTFRAAFLCKFERLDPLERAIVLGTTAAVFAHFVVSLTLIPPFFTTFKIFFFFLFMFYVVECYSRLSNAPKAQASETIPSLRLETSRWHSHPLRNSPR